MQRDMSSTYRWTSTDNLEENLSRKYAELRRAESKPSSYWREKEIARLEHYIKQIKVELAAREAQLRMI